MSDLQNRIENLLKKNIINISTVKDLRIKHLFNRILPLNNNIELKVGDFCKAIVVNKDQAKRQINLHLTYLIKQNKSICVNHLKLIGIIRDYDLKEEFSIFTYIGNFKLITLGTQITAQVKSITQKQNQTIYILSLRCQKQYHHITTGITNDTVQIPEKDFKIFKKSQMFSTYFLARYEEDLMNPRFFTNCCYQLKIKQQQSLDKNSITSQLGCLSIDYQRVRQTQERQWADLHFMEGLKSLKNQRPELALEHLNLAKSFGQKSSKIYIARGCALANLNNYSEGLRQIKQALRISPKNKQALEYAQRIKKQMSGKQLDKQDLQLKQRKSRDAQDSSDQYEQRREKRIKRSPSL